MRKKIGVAHFSVTLVLYYEYPCLALAGFKPTNILPIFY